MQFVPKSPASPSIVLLSSATTSASMMIKMSCGLLQLAAVLAPMKIFFDRVLGFLLILYMSHGNAEATKGGKVVSDALLTAEYTTGQDWETADFKHSYPKSVRDKVLNSWERLGFKKLE